MLSLLLTAPAFVQTVGYTELNSPDWVVTELTQRMRSPSTCRFRAADTLGTEAPLTPRAAVRFTADNGDVLFAGRVLPASRTLNQSTDVTEYAAADVSEYLAYNPCAEVNQWYNRDSTDENIVPYPTDKTWVQIIQTEFAPIVGAGRLIGALDFSDIPADVAALVPGNFQVKGKNWKTILEALAAEIPVIAWYYDCATCPANRIEGGTLRFYDLSKAPSSPVSVYLATRDDTDAAAANVKALSLNEDISQSVDTLVLHGWGTMRERIELATQGWNPAKAGLFSTSAKVYLVRNDQFYQVTDDLYDPSDPTAYNPGMPSPKYFDIDAASFPYQWKTLTEAANRPWFPETTLTDGRFAYRRYKVSREIVDLRLIRDGSTPPKYTKADQSMWVLGLRTTWNAGPLNFTINGNPYTGVFLDGVKIVPFTNGLVDDFGRAGINFSYYPSFPNEPIRKINLGAPAAYERNYFITAKSMVIRTDYLFTGVVAEAPSAATWQNISNTNGQSVSAYWGYGSSSHSGVYLRYTGKDALTLTRTDATLGYGKKAVLWDQRFLKYYNIQNELLRDDTVMMGKYADMLFGMLKRKRTYGSVSLVIAPAAQSSYPMGAFLRVHGWDGTTKTIGSRVQERNLVELTDRGQLTLTLDTPSSYNSLNASVAFRQFFAANEIRGSLGPSGSYVNNNFGGGGGGGGGGISPTVPGGGNGIDPIFPPGGGLGGGPDTGGAGGWGGSCCDPPSSDPNSSGS